ncbi:MAG: RidA family protein [Chloroflexi bacterium]|nr:RidA family protein [Chloroflexota bacterium]MCI0801110.1 RidA family protein [Chloroflexota bacterium]MCI0829453.1 RidA family protein [Chloroflexota bacterium]MCI0847845.1 RidA family protein [Chloroflexota bacterium]MCI0897456.1 RidA family protein [Chloroflexota bacterium]
MALERKQYPDIAPAGPTYSRAVIAGNTMFISGCTARGTDAQGKSMMEQLDVTLGRLVAVAAAEGAGPGSFAKLTCFVTSIADYQLDSQEQRSLFAKHFQEQYPANSLIEISALAEPGLDVEVEAIVILD